MGKRRFFYAAVGVIVLLLAGFIYAWSILSAPISADFPAWSNAQLSLTFTLCMAFFCLGGMAAGILSKRLSAGVSVRLSAVLFLAGFCLTARAHSLPTLYVGYGVLCGAASGFSYNAVMNVMPRWFPRRQGLISGILLMGFGSSSMVIGTLFTALTPAVSGAWRTSLLVMGLLMASILFFASFCFRPPVGVAASPGDALPAHTGPVLTPGQMVRRKSFWCFFLWAALLSAAGLVIIGQARSLALAAVPSLAPGALSLAVGLISVCNGLGRVVFGALFDRVGQGCTLFVVTCTLLAGAVLLALSFPTGAVPVLVAGFVLTGLGYGGGPTMNAAVTKRLYGQEHYAVNFSIVNTNLLVAACANTAAGLLCDALGGYAAVFFLLFFLLCAAFAALLAMRHPLPRFRHPHTKTAPES